MKKIIAVFVLLFASMYALAQYFELDHKLQCNDTNSILSAINERYKEEPIWIGNISDNVKAILFVNIETSSWTYVVVSQTKACVVNTGDGFSLRQPVRSNKLTYSIDNNSSI